MAVPEVHSQSTVHEQAEDSEAYVRASPGPARDTLPNTGRSATELTERSRRLIEERWGKRIEEPVQDAPADPDRRPQMRDVLNQFHLYRDPSPSIKAIWVDLCEGGARVFDEHGMFIAALYWAPGVVGHGIVWVCEVVKTICSRPGRMYGAGFVLLLLWIALAIAGLDPVSLSDLNPF